MAQATLEQHAAKDEHARKQITLGLISVFVINAVGAYFMQTRGVAMPKMAADLNGMAWYAWAVSMPGLAGAFVTLIFSRFSDMYGRRIMLLISLSLLLLGTILCAISPTFVFLIAASCLARFGSGAIGPLLLAVLGDMFPPVERSRWVGLLQIPSGLFALIGPSLGGWLVDNLSWRYIFWLGVPLLVICLAVAPMGIPSAKDGRSRKIDVRGCLFVMIASSAAILGFSFAGTTYPWASVQVIGLITTAIVFLVLFLQAEFKADEPLLDPQVFMNRTFLIVVLSGLMSTFGMTAMNMYYPLFLQGVQGMSALRSGQILTPFGVLTAFVGVPTGFLLARTKRYKWMFVLSYAILTVVYFGAIFLTATTPMIWCAAVATMAGLGIGAVPVIKTLVVQFSVPKRLLAVATGAYFFSVAIGATIAPAILGSVMNVSYIRSLKATLPAEFYRAAGDELTTLLGNSRVLVSKQEMKALEKSFNKPGNGGKELFNKTVDAMRTSMEAGIRSVFLVGAVAMLVALLLIITIPVISMDVEVKDRRASV